MAGSGLGGRDHSDGERGGSTSNFVGEESLKIQVPRRRGRKNQKRYESDSDSQIALRLARLRRDVLELQEESEEEILEEHKEDDDALIRLRSFRESLGIPDAEPLLLSPPKAKRNYKRRHHPTIKYPQKKEFEESLEMSESQLLERLQQLRQSLTSPERSKSSKQQGEARKKRIRPRGKKSSDRIPSIYEVVNAEHSLSEEHVDVQGNTLNLEGVNLGVAKDLQNHWAMDLNNVIQMEFGIEGGHHVDHQYGAPDCGHMEQYAQ